MLCDAKGPDPWSSKPDRLVLARSWSYNAITSLGFPM